MSFRHPWGKISCKIAWHNHTGWFSAKPTPKTRRRATSVINVTAMDVAGIYERSLRHGTCILSIALPNWVLAPGFKAFWGQPKEQQKLWISDGFFFGSKWWIECWQIYLVTILESTSVGALRNRRIACLQRNLNLLFLVCCFRAYKFYKFRIPQVWKIFEITTSVKAGFKGHPNARMKMAISLVRIR